MFFISNFNLHRYLINLFSYHWYLIYQKMTFGMCIFPDLRMFQSILMLCDFFSSRRKHILVLTISNAGLSERLKKCLESLSYRMFWYFSTKLSCSNKPVISDNDISVRFNRTSDCSDDVRNFNISQLIVDNNPDSFGLNADQEFTSKFVTDPIDPADPAEWRIRTSELTHDDLCIVSTDLRSNLCKLLYMQTSLYICRLFSEISHFCNGELTLLVHCLF